MHIGLKDRNSLIRRITRSLFVCAAVCALFLKPGVSQAAISFRAAESNGIDSATASTITHIGAGSAQGITGCGSITPSIPAGNVDDLLIALAVTKEIHASNSVSMPGWNSYHVTSNAGANDESELQTYIFWRIADGSDPNTMTQSGSACNGFGGQISRFRGVDTASPFETVSPGVVYQNSDNLDTGTITTTSATAMLLVAGFVSNNGSVSEGAGWSESFDFAYNDGGAEPDFTVTLNYQLQASAGNKSISNWALSSGTDENLGAILALTPSAGGLTINVPAGTTTDDVMIASIAWRSNSPVIAPPSGWTLIRETDQSAGGVASNRLASYYRIVTGVEPAAYTWNFTGGTFSGASGGIISFSGVDTSSPIDEEGGNTTPDGFSHTANAISTTVANTMLVSSHEFPSATSDWTEPTGMTEAVDQASIPTPDTVGIALSMNYELQASTGTTGDKTAVAAAGGTDSGSGAAHLLALAPSSIPAPLAEWRLDESSWNGSAGEVVDETGTYHGTAQNGAQTDDSNRAVPGDPGTCGYGTFDDAGGGSGDYVEIPGFPNRTTDFTITAWINTQDNTRAGQRVFADDENNAEGGYALSVGDGGSGRLRFYSRDVNNIILDSNAVISSNTWYFIAGVADIANSQRIIYIYNSSGTLIDTVSDTFTGTWGTASGPATIGGETNSGETGNRFYGSIDEVRFYGSALSQTDIETIINDTHACAITPVASTVYMTTNNDAEIGGNTFEDGDLFEYVVDTDTSTSPPYFDESASPPGVPNIDMDAAHFIDADTLVFSNAHNELIDGTVYEDGSLILYDFATDTFSEFFNENFFSGGADIDAVYVISHSATQSVFLASTNNTETVGGNSFTDGDVFQVIYDHPNGVGGAGESITTSIVLDESIYGTNVDVDAVHILDSGNYLLSMDNNETFGGFAFEDGDLIEYDPVGGTFSEFLSEDRYTGNEDVTAVTQIPTVTGIDHYDIDINPSAGITCVPATVSITAKDASNATVAHTSATTINLATSTGAGTWGTASVGAVTNVVVGAGTADYQFANGQSTVDIQLNYPLLVGAAPETVNVNITSTPNETTGVAVAAEDDPSVDFYTSALIINNVTDGNNTIPTQISGKDSDGSPNAVTLNIQGVRASDSDPSVCESIFSDGAVVAVDLGAECKNPGQCEGQQLEITNSAPATSGGVNIATSDDDGGAQTVAAYTTVDLEVGTGSNATVVLNYPDAGLMQLHMRYELLLDDGTPTGEFAIGISNDFVVKPAGLCVESTDTDSDCASGDETCSVFRKAGSVNAENLFNLTVRGVTFESAGESDDQFCSGSNATTPNFELNSIALAPNLVAPVGVGTTTGTLGVTSIDIVDADNGSETVTTQSVSEVGVFTITAAPPTYLGETITASTSANIGRFIPDRFNVAMQNTPEFANACSVFTYQDQPFYYGTAPVLEITALNSNGVTTSNYGGNFWMLDGGTLDRDYTDGSSAAASLSPTTTQSNGFTLGGDTDFNGIGTFTLDSGSSGDEFMYQKAMPLDTPEEPFDADVDISFAAAGFQDADHNPPTRTVCYDSNNDDTCESFTFDMIQGTELRWGRLIVQNVFGSELLPLSVPLTSQYFSGGLFVTNTDDNCTTYQAGDAALADVTASDNIVPGDTTVSSPVASNMLVNGVSAFPNHLIVDAPGAGKTGSLDLGLDLSAATGSDQEWLRFDGADPVGRVTFGVYNGPEEFIYMREPW